MEGLLSKILVDAHSKKNTSLLDVAQHAFDCVLAVQGDKHAEIHVLREKCLTALEQSIDCKGKFAQLGIEGLQIILRDNLFHSIDASSENDTDTLPIQLLNTLHSLPNWSQDSSTQCHCLTVILQLMCSSSWTITCQAVTQSLDLCYATYSSTTNVSVHMAARATVSQIVQSYCSYNNTAQDVRSKSDSTQDMKELLVFCCDKLKIMYSSKTPNSSLLLAVDSILAILISQNKDSYQNEDFTNIIWEKLCPCLIEIMGWTLPKSAPNSPQSSPSKEVIKPIANMPEVMKSVYLVCGELVRLVGPLAELRNLLEIVFEKVFLSVHIDKRTDCLKCLKKFFSTPGMFVDLFPLKNDIDPRIYDVTQTNPSGQLALWKVFLDCIYECSRSKQLAVVSACIDVLHTILTNLLELCQNEQIVVDKDMMDVVNKNYSTLKKAEEEAFAYECDERAMGLLSKMYCMDYVDNTPSQPTSPTIQPENVDVSAEETKEDSDVDDCLTNLASRISSAMANNERLCSLQAKITDQLNKEADKTRPVHVAEENNAKYFVKSLQNEIEKWTDLKSIIEVDEHFQTFASSFAQEFTQEQEDNYDTIEHAVLNADAVYLTTFHALRLAFACFKNENCVSEDTFCKGILESGCIVYVSESWLRCVYRGILEDSKAFGALMTDDFEILPLHSIVVDFSGESCDLLWDVLRLQKAIRKCGTSSSRTLAAQKYSRRIITASWNGLQAIISNVILGLREGGTKNFQAWALRKSKNETTSLVGDGLALSVSALHKLAKLCNILKLQNRNGCILGQLVEVSCPLEDLKKWNYQKMDKGQLWPLRASDALSMEIVISNAIDTGTHDKECWKYILRCCEFVWELDRSVFAETNKKERIVSHKLNLPKRNTKNEKNKTEDQENPLLLPSFVQSCKTVANTLETCTDSNVILDASTTAKVVLLLVEKVDELLDSASRCLNLDALCELCNAMVSVSQDRLFYSSNPQSFHQTAFLIRLSRLMIDLPKSSRPLAHLMQVWASVNAHFIEATCSDDLSISSTALTCLHECVTGLLLEEFNNFYFNYSLIRPLQTTLCIDMCNIGVQDQIIGIISELVEVHSGTLMSGWKPLFGALRALRASWDAQTKKSSCIDEMYMTALNVLKVYLDIDDLNVFCLAANDCIQCLFKYLQTTELVNEEDVDDDDSSEAAILCGPALVLLQRLHTIMITLWNKPDIRSSQLGNRLSLRERSPQSLDRQAVDESVMQSLHCLIQDRGFFGVSSANRGHWLQHDSVDKPLPPPWTNMINSQRAVIELWLSLLEGTVSAVSTCPRVLQPNVLNTLNTFMTQLLEQPGPEFGTYCMVHLLLPMLENWMRREARYSTGWRENSPSVSNFKQAIGLSTDLVLQYIQSQYNMPSGERLLKDSLYLLTECIAQNSEVVSRVGCSSVRHLVMQCGHNLTQGGWYIVCRALWRAVNCTLNPLRMVMSHFEANSHEYYGDYGKVQVALRKDSNPREASRVRLLAQQVFLLDSQKFSENLEDHPDSLSQSHRSVILLLFEEKNSANPNRLPFRDVVVSLLSHQLLLQLIGNILLDGCKLKVSGVASLLLRNLLSQKTENNGDKLAGYLGSLNGDHMHALLLCLESSFQIAYDFDSRPGMKFLFQKVFNSTVAANLYKQAVTAWTLRCVTLFELVHRTDLSNKKIKQLCQANELQETCFPAEAPLATCIDAAILLMANDCMLIAKQLHLVEANVKASAAVETVDDDGEHVVFLLASPENKNDDSMYVMEKVDENEQSQQGQGTQADNGHDKHIHVDETVYDVASNDTLANVLKEYKKRRHLATMPSSDKTKIVRRNPFEQKTELSSTTADDGKDAELIEEQKQAGLKDGDARLIAWCEMGLCPLQYIFELVMREEDGSFIQLLPVVHPAVLQLTAGCTQQRVRHMVTDYLHRITALFHILDQD